MEQAKLIGTGIILFIGVMSAYGIYRAVKDQKVSAGPMGWKSKEEAPLVYWFYLAVMGLMFVGAIFLAFQINKL